ncbi:MAG: hypothetical protein OT477_09800 [Chloroflexi bacterium]|nr:hypothetical protein [Chloroflexota bacterium]
MLILPEPLHEQIKAHGAASYPLEGCGLLVGLAEDGRNTVHAIPAPCPMCGQTRLKSLCAS